jgi:hypothetical protein
MIILPAFYFIHHEREICSNRNVQMVNSETILISHFALQKYSTKTNKFI